MMIEEVQFEMLKRSTRRIIPRSSVVAYQSRINTFLEAILDDMVMELDTHVMADKNLDAEIEVPYKYQQWESWWQHTKSRHFPTFSRWLRRPPRSVTVKDYVTINVRQYVTFPHADIYPVNMGRPVVVQRWDRVV